MGRGGSAGHDGGSDSDDLDVAPGAQNLGFPTDEERVALRASAREAAPRRTSIDHLGDVSTVEIEELRREIEEIKRSIRPAETVSKDIGALCAFRDGQQAQNTKLQNDVDAANASCTSLQGQMDTIKSYRDGRKDALEWTGKIAWTIIPLIVGGLGGSFVSLNYFDSHSADIDAVKEAVKAHEEEVEDRLHELELLLMQPR